MSEETKKEQDVRRRPGNPFTRRVAQLRCLLMAKMTDEALSDIADKLIELARGGDLAAIRLALQYAVGLPAKASDPDGLDADELRRYREERVPVEEVSPLVIDAPTASEVNTYARAFSPERRTWISRGVEKQQAENARADAEAAQTDAEVREAFAEVEPTPYPRPPAPPLPMPQEVLNVSLDDLLRQFQADCKREWDQLVAARHHDPTKRRPATP